MDLITSLCYVKIRLSLNSVLSQVKRTVKRIFIKLKDLLSRQAANEVFDSLVLQDIVLYEF